MEVQPILAVITKPGLIVTTRNEIVGPVSVVVPETVGKSGETTNLSPEAKKAKKEKIFVDKIKEKLNTPFYNILYDSKKGALIISRSNEDEYARYKEGYPFVKYNKAISNPYTMSAIKKQLLIKDEAITKANKGTANLYNITDKSDTFCDDLDSRFLKPGAKIEIPINIINTEKQYYILEGAQNKELQAWIKELKED